MLAYSLCKIALKFWEKSMTYDINWRRFGLRAENKYREGDAFGSNEEHFWLYFYLFLNWFDTAAENWKIKSFLD